MKSERVQHFARVPEANSLALLLDGKGCQINQNEPILAPGQSETWMAGDLQDEIPVSPFVQEICRRRLLDRQSTEHEWPRAESQGLIPLLSLEPDLAAGFNCSKFSLRNNQLWSYPLQDGPRQCYGTDSVTLARRHSSCECILQPSRSPALLKRSAEAANKAPYRRHFSYSSDFQKVNCRNVPTKATTVLVFTFTFNECKKQRIGVSHESREVYHFSECSGHRRFSDSFRDPVAEATLFVDIPFCAGNANSARTRSARGWNL